MAGIKTGVDGQINNNIQTNGLVCYWDASIDKSFTSGTSKTYNLSSGSLTPTGSIHNDVDFEGPLTASWIFDGTDDIILIDPISISSEVTVITWTKVSTWQNYDAFVTQINSAGSFLLNQNTAVSAGSLYFAIYQSDATFKQIVNNGVAPTNEWFHYAGVADGSYVRMYLNGVEIGTPVAYDGTIRTSTDQVAIAGRANSIYLLQGAVANALIYTRGLSASEILQNYNATKNRFI